MREHGYLDDRLKKLEIEIGRLTKVLAWRCRERKHIIDMLEQLEQPELSGLEVIQNDAVQNGFK